MPFERDDRYAAAGVYERSEKLHGLGLGLGMGQASSHSLLPMPSGGRGRRQMSKWRGLAISLTVIGIFILVLVGPAVPLRRMLSDTVSRDVDALRSLVSSDHSAIAVDVAAVDTDELAQPDSVLSKRQQDGVYRPAFGPGQGRRSAIIAAAAAHARRDSAVQRRSAAIDDAIAHKLADLHGPGGVTAASVYTSQEHYDEDKALEQPRSVEEGVVDTEDESADTTETLLTDEAEEVLSPHRHILPAAPKAPWSLENEINAKQREAGQLASS